MHKGHLPNDPSMEKAVERRRAAETARKARIFNTRQRVIGLDLDTLNKQVQEKKHLQNIQRQQDEAFDKVRENHDQVLLQKEAKERETQAALHTDLTQYWATYQRAEDSRDADLNCGLKGACVTTLPEEELGPASMQVFQGEDIGEVQRKREQMKKRDRDLQAQQEDIERRHLVDNHKEMLMTDEMQLQNLQWIQRHELDEEQRRAARMAVDNYNLALATEQADKVKEQQRREERENVAEITHILNSDLMTECPEAALKKVGGRRSAHILTDRWKGMSPGQVSAIRKEQEAQRLEKQRLLDAKRMQDAAWDFRLLKASMEADDVERKKEDVKKAQRIQTDQYNKQLALEQQAHQQYLNKTLYTNKATKDFFHQFSTSSR